MLYTTLFFDLDDTLYDSANGLWKAIRERMGRFMIEEVGLPPDQVPGLRRLYYEKYGTTLRGLRIHHHIDPDVFLAFVHDLPLREYLKPAPQLREMLLSLPQARWILTNADQAHARRVISALGLEGCFDGIVDVRALDYVNKPDVEAYRRAMQIACESQPERCVLFDDAPGNLAPARQLGFTTVLVGSQAHHPDAHYTLRNLMQLPEVMPELWDYTRLETEE